MARPSTQILDILDIRPLLRGSRIRIGGLQARGVPAVLCGVAAVVFAAGLTDALQRAATALPDTIRETRNVMLLTRGARELPSTN